MPEYIDFNFILHAPDSWHSSWWLEELELSGEEVVDVGLSALEGREVDDLSKIVVEQKAEMGKSHHNFEAFVAGVLNRIYRQCGIDFADSKPPLPPGVTRHKAMPSSALQLPDTACFMKGR